MVVHASSRRPVAAAVVFTVVFALCAVPLYWTAVFAVAGFTGCFLGCSEPEPAVGALWGGLALCIALVPVVAAALAGGYRVRTATVAAGVLVLGGVAVLVVGHGAV